MSKQLKAQLSFVSGYIAVASLVDLCFIVVQCRCSVNSLPLHVRVLKVSTAAAVCLQQPTVIHWALMNLSGCPIKGQLSADRQSQALQCCYGVDQDAASLTQTAEYVMPAAACRLIVPRQADTR
jgi:hypothetical protein